MKRLLVLLLLVSGAAVDLQAQFSRYIVRLKNKGGTPYSLASPANYLTQRAIDRRTRYGIALDSTDLPVTPAYVNQIRNVPNVTILNVSKWLNSISIQTTNPNAIATINAFPFVQSVGPIAARNSEEGGRTTREKFSFEVNPPNITDNIESTNADFYNYGTASYNEIRLHNGEFLHNIGLRGQGMVISLLDAGYFNYPNLRAFDSARLNGQILSTWDFVAREQSVTEDHSHGMMCLSTIIANIPGQFIGKAPKASVHLFRTEDAPTEYPIEEHNWVCGAERADSLGSDVISSSLGYFDFDDAMFNYTYAQLNGNTTMSAIGADLAAKKGLLVFNAAGNTGASADRFIITPADADSVVAVGAVTSSGAVGSFSSYGPSSDGQIKPDVASVGVNALVQNTNNTVITNNGTSFACPNMAGLGTALWQGFPEYNNMKIIRALQQAGSKATAPDNRVGYGIPNMKLAFGNLLTEYATSTSSISGCRVLINWTTKDMSAMKFEIERKAPGENVFTKVGEVSSQGGAILANRNYQFNNDLSNGSMGSYTYRIRQILDTATANFYAVYIDTTTVNISSACIGTGTPNPDPNKVRVSVQPNLVPTTSAKLVIESPFAVADMPITVYDARGEKLIELKESKGTGRKEVFIDVAKLPKGIYYIRVTSTDRLLGVAEFIKL